ncbi:MAG: hypothetical protein NC389_16540, partial [Acetatifactor muris]|nr:hypothetical protein [Acetatifactor muris]
EWLEALAVFQELAGGEWGVFWFEPSGIGFEPSPYVQFEPPQGKIKKYSLKYYSKNDSVYSKNFVF